MQATVIALDSIAPNTMALFEGLQAVSSMARLLSQGEPVGVAEVDQPPPDSGILGPLQRPGLAHRHHRLWRIVV